MKLSERVERYIELDFSGVDEQNLKTGVGEFVREPWTTAETRADELKEKQACEHILAFQREAASNEPSVYLSLYSNDNFSWILPNVVPTKFSDRLTIKKYNDILTEFNRETVEKVRNSWYFPLLATKHLHFASKSANM